MTEPSSLVSNGAEMLVDTENDQDEFRNDPRQNNTHTGAEQARDQEIIPTNGFNAMVASAETAPASPISTEITTASQ